LCADCIMEAGMYLLVRSCMVIHVIEVGAQLVVRLAEALPEVQVAGSDLPLHIKAGGSGQPVCQRPGGPHLAVSGGTHAAVQQVGIYQYADAAFAADGMVCPCFEPAAPVVLADGVLPVYPVLPRKGAVIALFALVAGVLRAKAAIHIPAAVTKVQVQRCVFPGQAALAIAGGEAAIHASFQALFGFDIENAGIAGSIVTGRRVGNNLYAL